MSLHDDMLLMGDRAVAAARALARLSSRRKNAILEAMADELDARRDLIKTANAKDMEAGHAAGLSAAMLDRLQLTDARIDAMIKGFRAVVGLKDPVGAKISRWIRPNGLVIQKVACRSASSPSSTSRARTSPPTPPACASRPPTP